MKSYVRLMDGLLQDATVYDATDEIVFNLTANSRTVRNVLIAYTGGELRVFKILRKPNYKHIGIRTLLNDLSENLMSFYQLPFTGICWGMPEVTYDRQLRAFALNRTLLFREDGYLYPGLKQAIERDGLSVSGIPELLAFLSAFTEKVE